MIMLKGRTAMLSAGLLFALAGTALADVPAVLDRVPANAGMVIAVRNMEQTKDRMESMSKKLNAPMDQGGDDNPLNMAKKLLGTAGLNKTGSMAVVMMPGDNGQMELEGEEGKENAFILVPVSDYSAFAKGMGATDAAGVSAITVDEKPAFLKDIGGGYAAMGPSKDRIGAFEGKPGNQATHVKSLGKAGAQIADRSDVLFVMNVAAFKTQIDEGVAKMKEETNDMVEMAGPQGEQLKGMIGVMQGIAESFARDGQVGIAGLGLGEAGVSIDFGAQFKEGSDSAKMLSNTGNASSFLARLPAQPFLMAFAMDMTNPGVKNFMKAMNKAGEQNPMGVGLGNLKDVEKLNGMAMVMGASKGGIMGGLFANTTTFISTADPKAYVASLQDTMKEMNGKEVEGIKFSTEYKPAEADVAGVKADTWTMSMEADEENPQAGMIGMMQQMMFGPEGPGGMLAPVENGVVMSMSKNTPLFTSAVEAGKSGNGLANEAMIKDVQAQLPNNRMFEFYLGTKSIMEAINGAMGMMGGGAQMKVPAKVSHIGMAAGAEGGGVDFRIFVPTDVIETIAAAAKEMQQMEEGEDEEGGDGEAAPADSKPRF